MKISQIETLYPSLYHSLEILADDRAKWLNPEFDINYQTDKFESFERYLAELSEQAFYYAIFKETNIVSQFYTYCVYSKLFVNFKELVDITIDKIT